jgi:hypothetical protein
MSDFCKQQPRRASTRGAVAVLAILMFTACGDDEPQNPSIAGVCDFERELDDCYEEESFILLGDDPASFEAVCSVTCNELNAVTVNGADRAQLRALDAFDHIRSVRMLNSRSDVTEISFLEGQTTITNLELTGNSGLKTLAGLESLETIQPADGSFEIGEPMGFLSITDSGLEEISLPSLRLAQIRVLSAGSLRTVGLPALEDGYLEFTGTSVRSISGVNETTAINGGIRLQRNRSLTRLDAFQSLEFAGGFTIEDNSSLPCAEIEPIATGLETGDFPFVISGNREPCDIMAQ